MQFKALINNYIYIQYCKIYFLPFVVVHDISLFFLVHFYLLFSLYSSHCLRSLSYFLCIAAVGWNFYYNKCANSFTKHTLYLCRRKFSSPICSLMAFLTLLFLADSELWYWMKVNTKEWNVPIQILFWWKEITHVNMKTPQWMCIVAVNSKYMNLVFIFSWIKTKGLLNTCESL